MRPLGEEMHLLIKNTRTGVHTGTCFMGGRVKWGWSELFELQQILAIFKTSVIETCLLPLCQRHLTSFGVYVLNFFSTSRQLRAHTELCPNYMANMVWQLTRYMYLMEGRCKKTHDKTVSGSILKFVHIMSQRSPVFEVSALSTTLTTAILNR